MASGKKKLDEYHLKILRELVSLTSNKQCFDCHQRGPTYVNVTIGSFVCTTCSGMLRGLTPPHRVKSISMATFTPDEVDFVKARGNEYCRRVWLGLCDNDQPTKDEQQIKDFMISKYEKKRYYLNPSTNPTVNGSSSGSLSPNNTTTPSTPSSHSKPSINSSFTVNTSTVSNNSVPVPIPTIAHPSTFQLKPPSTNNRSTNSNSTSAQIITMNGTNSSNNNMNHNNNVFTPDQFFSADFSKATNDPFSSSSNSNSQFGTVPPQPNFANFDNNPIFNSSMSGPGGLTEPWGSTSSHFSLPSSLTFEIPMRTLQQNVVPTNRWSFAGVSSNNSDSSEDRYAALKHLDSERKSQQQQQQLLQQQSSAQTTGLDWGTNGGVGMGIWPNVAATNVFSSTTTQGGDTKTVVTSNPFAAGENIWGSSNAFNANPFRSNVSGGTDGVWSGAPNGQLTNGFPTSHSLNFGPAKSTWNDPISNPFTIGSSTHATGHHSSNPFL